MVEGQFAGVQPRLLLSIPNQEPGAGTAAFQAFALPQWSSYEAAGMGPFTGFFDSNPGWTVFDGPRSNSFLADLGWRMGLAHHDAAQSLNR